MNIYLAGPVDLAPQGASINEKSWKQRLQDLAATRNDHDSLDGQFTFYDPAKPWGLSNQFIHTRRRCAWIELVNRAAIKGSDIVVASVPHNVVSVGTPIEIADAIVGDKYVIVLSDIPYGKNAYLTNRIVPDDYVYCEGSVVTDEHIEKVLSIIAKRSARRWAFHSDGRSVNMDATLVHILNKIERDLKEKSDALSKEYVGPLEELQAAAELSDMVKAVEES